MYYRPGTVDLMASQVMLHMCIVHSADGSTFVREMTSRLDAILKV